MSIAVLLMTDGRDDYLWRTLAAARHLRGQITEWWVHDDTGDDAYRDRLMADLPEFGALHAGPRRGFGGAIRRAWSELIARSRADYVFHLEADFRLTRRVDLDAMADVLDHAGLSQLVLRRQPWNAAEAAAGGIVEQRPEQYVDCGWREHEWLAHRLFWSTNPGLYPREIMTRGWPPDPHSEGHFGIQLFADPTAMVGFWGNRTSGVWAEHIGRERVGTGY